MVEVGEDEKTLRRFKKAEDFDELNAAVKEGDDYENTKYESDEKKVQNEGGGMENPIILNG